MTAVLHLVLKDPAHHVPNQTEIATEEFCPKSLLRKQNEIDFIEVIFAKKCKIFERWGLRPQAPVPPTAAPNSPPLRFSGYAPVHKVFKF